MKKSRDKRIFPEIQRKMIQSKNYHLPLLCKIIQSICRSDVCESKIEVSTPYWASNSNGKVRAILNNKEFEQAVHQEICT